MGLFSKKIAEPVKDKFQPGDKVYLSTFVHVYEAEVLTKSDGRLALDSGTYYIIKIPKTKETLRVAEDMLTATPSVPAHKGGKR